MPIRMVEDPNDREPSGQNSDPGRSSGGLGGFGALLPLLLGFLLRRPKLLIPLLIIGGIVYFFRGGCSGGSILPADKGQPAGYSIGADLKPEEYAKQDIFNFLEDGPGGKSLPAQVSLLRYAPKPGNQGSQGSCVAWASAYAARTILYARQTGKNPDDVRFSPAFMYNQIKLDGCQGSYLQRAVENMSRVGAVPFGDFDYNEFDCDRRPPDNLFDKAGNFRISGAARVSDGAGRPGAVDVQAIRQTLAAGAPVIIGMMVGGTFMRDMEGRKVWHPTSEDATLRGFGGHAMCVTGYDDNLEGGAFQIMNSWGPGWGENGVAWVRYKDFAYFTREAMALAPMGAAGDKPPARFEAAFSLILSESATEIPLVHAGQGLFETRSRLKPGTKFRIRFRNNVECYSYVFGQETDFSSYVLYPYTPKHSPYCGVTGTRVFPRGYHMVPDDKGGKDYMAVVVSRKPLDYQELNKRVNAAGKNDYAAAFRSALGQDVALPEFTGNRGDVVFSTAISDTRPVLVIIAVNK